MVLPSYYVNMESMTSPRSNKNSMELLEGVGWSNGLVIGENV